MKSHVIIKLYAGDLYVHVPKTLKAQICLGEYVDMALLLKVAMEHHDMCMGCTLSLTESGTIVSVPRECIDKAHSIKKETVAFIIYLSIYVKDHSTEACLMLQYY